MKRPESDIRNIQEIINKQITEEEFFDKRTDSEGKLNIDLQEIDVLKKHAGYLKDFLLSLSIHGRFRILMCREMLGMTQNSFISKYGLQKNHARILKGQHELDSRSSAKIRHIKSKSKVPHEILATLAIFNRVPIEWLQEEVPLTPSSLNVHNFHSVPDVHLSSDEFLAYLTKTENDAINEKVKHTRPKFNYVYDVRPVILHSGSKQIYLRTTFWERGGFIVELFGMRDQLDDFITLKKIFYPYGPLEVGYCETVIEGHINIMVIAKSRANEISYPVEFKKF